LKGIKMRLRELKELIDNALESGVNPNLRVFMTVDDGDDIEYTREVSHGDEVGLDKDEIYTILKEDMEKDDELVFELI